MSQVNENQDLEGAVETPDSGVDQDVMDFFDDSPMPVVEVVDAKEEPVQAVAGAEVEKTPASVSQEPAAQEAVEGFGDSPEDEAGQLRKQLDELMGKLVEQKVQAPQQKAIEEELKLPEDPRQITTIDFLGEGVELVDLVENREAFNAILNRVATTAAQAGRRAGYEDALRAIPEVVKRSTAQEKEVQTVSENFYRLNPDLTSYKSAVSLASMEYYSKNPNATMEEVLKGAGELTRKMLRIRGSAPARPAAKPIGLGGGAAADRMATAEKLTDTEQQILDLVNYV